MIKLLLVWLYLRFLHVFDIEVWRDVDGYVGKSTSNQIDYAKLLNKPVLYYSKGEVERL